ncbi:hypothetical protein C0J52_19050 [Blattella germanica]|nr:hypothetical protein C0J52_19050 [Blattella germanica]
MDLKETIAVDCIKQEVNDVPEVESEYSNHSEKDEKIHFEMLPIEKCENQEIGDIVKFKPDCSREIKIEEEEFTSFHLSMPDVKEETQVSPWQTALSVEENSKYKSDHEDIRNNTFSHSDCLNPPHEHRKSNVKVVLADEIVPKVSPWQTGLSVEEHKYKSDYEDFRNNTVSHSDCLNLPHDNRKSNVNVVVSDGIIRKDSFFSCGKLNFASSTTTTESVDPSIYLECILASSEKEDFQQLMKSQKPNRPFQCKICSKSFTRKTDLKRHMIIHSSSPPYQCKICSKYFNQKSNLDRHRYTHTDKYPFQCEICSKSFTQKSYLSTHMITHTSNRPFPCDICGKSFTRKDNLSAHMITHTSNRPFQCEICYKSFTQKNNLNTHMITHTSNRPFQCEICSKSFTQKTNLSTHIITHTSNRPFQCEICSKSFTRKSHLSTHMVTHSRNSQK